MKKRTLVIAKLLILLLVGGGGAILWLSSRDATPTEAHATNPITTIEALRNSGAFAQAYSAAISAQEEDPSNAIFAMEAGELALILRKPARAGEHMRTAWKLGARELPALLVMVDTFSGSTAEKIELFNELFEELPQTPEHLNAKAKFYSRAGLDDEALEIWRALCEASPSEEIILQIARKLEMTGQREASIALLQQYAEEGHIATEGYNLLLSLLVFDNQFEAASQLTPTLTLDDPYGEWALKTAMFSLVQGKIPEAAQTLELLKKASADHPVAYAVSHEARICLALLRLILSGTEAQFDDLATLAIQEVQFFPTRTITTPLLGLHANPKQIEGERLLYDFFESAQQGTLPSNTRYLRLASLLPDSPTITWLGIRHALSAGQPADAITRYSKINTTHPLERIEGSAGFFYKSPLFIFEAARAFNANNRPNEALSLINHLHERALYTPDSIRLFAQITQETGSAADITAMQDALARQFKDDIDIQLSSVSLAYAQGEADHALEILSPLIEKEAQTEELQMIELMIMLNQGKADQVLQRCIEGNLPEHNKNLVQARAWIQKGDRQKAESFFKKALNPTNDFYGFLDYARFLVEEGRTEDAALLYEELLTQQPNNVVALQGQAIIDELNEKPDDAIQKLKKVLRIIPDDAYTQTRLAKVYLQKGDASEALSRVNKVLAKDPKNKDATYLQTLAMIQLALDQPIQTLRQRKLGEVKQKLDHRLVEIPNDPQFLLRIYLAGAFQETEQADAAETIYRDLLALDSSAWKNTPLQRSEVQKALEALNE